MPTTPALADRLRSRDLVVRASADVELGAALVDALRGSLIEPPAPELVRALADVTTADVLGIVPPVSVFPTAPGPRPLWAFATPFRPSSTYHVGVVETLPPAVLDPAEKVDVTASGLDVANVIDSGHTAAAVLGNAAIQVVQRAMLGVRVAGDRVQTPEQVAASSGLIAFYRALGTWVAHATLEQAHMTDLVATAGLVPATDFLAAIGTAAAFGGRVLVLAGAGAFGPAANALGPSGLVASGAVVVVPVQTAAADAKKAIVVAEGNLDLRASAPMELIGADVARLGIEHAIVIASVAAIHFPTVAALVTLP